LIFGLTIRIRLGATPTGFFFFEKNVARIATCRRYYLSIALIFLSKNVRFCRNPLLSSCISAFITMKKEFLPKQLLFVAAIVSLLAFAFVNLHANGTKSAVAQRAGLAQTKVEEPKERDQEIAEIKMPNLTLLGRVWEIAQRLLEKTN
jgi:hypothetical protein